MKFDKPFCPHCGQLAKGTLETLPGVALLMFDEDNEATYEGETEVDWDGQTPCLDEHGQVTLTCPEGHEWPSPVEDLDK